MSPGLFAFQSRNEFSLSSTAARSTARRCGGGTPSASPRTAGRRAAQPFSDARARRSSISGASRERQCASGWCGAVRLVSTARSWQAPSRLRRRCASSAQTCPSRGHSGSIRSIWWRCSTTRRRRSCRCSALGVRPVVRHQLARAPVGRDQPVGHGVEIDRLERPALERQRGVVEIARQLVAHVLA